MAADCGVQLQFKARENAQELNDFLKDLGKWEKEVKKQDEDLKKEKIIEKLDIPPIRNKKRTKKTPKKKAEQIETRDEKKSKISSCDYDAWSKFDVDAAVDEVDKESEESEESDISDEEYLEEMEKIEQERKMQKANLEKDKGNELFKEGKYEAAINRYTIGIELDPNNPILPANRAMALIKIERYGVAEVDCTTSLELDPTYVKAMARRATARQKLGKLELAKMDYDEILVLQPNNTQATTELRKINKELSSRKPQNMNMHECAPSRKRRSNKPLKRILIEEIGSDSDCESEEKNIEEKDPTTNVVKTHGLPTSSQSTETTKLLLQKRSLVVEKEEQIELPGKNIIFNIPKTSVQFETDFRRLKNDIGQLYSYIKVIPPESYCKLFSQIIDEVLPKILRCFKECYTRDNLSFWEELKSISKVPRFEMATMFLTRKDIDVVKTLFDQLITDNAKDQFRISENEVHQLARNYGIQPS